MCRGLMATGFTVRLPNWHLVNARFAFAVLAMAFPEPTAGGHASSVVGRNEVSGRLDRKDTSGKLPIAPLPAVPGRFGRWEDFVVADSNELSGISG
jgi:hypothetical protein